MAAVAAALAAVAAALAAAAGAGRPAGRPAGQLVGRRGRGYPARRVHAVLDCVLRAILWTPWGTQLYSFFGVSVDLASN